MAVSAEEVIHVEIPDNAKRMYSRGAAHHEAAHAIILLAHRIPVTSVAVYRLHRSGGLGIGGRTVT